MSETEHTTDPAMGHDGDEGGLPALRDTEPDIDHYYENLRKYVRMVSRGFSNALLLNSPPGIGKTYQINRTLDEETGSDGYIEHGGYCTPVKLFEKLWEASGGKVLFLDDIEGLISNDKALALLKQATWSDDDERVVSWSSSTSAIDDEIPEEFDFQGSVVMCFNEVPDDPIFDSLRSRCLYYELDFTYDEKIDVVREVAKKPYKNVAYETRMEIAEWIERNTAPGMDGVSLRSLFHCMDMAAFDPDEWESMASELFDADEDVRLVGELVAEYDHMGEAIDEFERRTGKTRRTFYRYKRRIESDT